MRRIIALSIIISTVFLVSCENMSNNNNVNGVSMDDINILEKELFNSKTKTIDSKKAKQLSQYYVEYADMHPNDSVSPDFLYKAADISMNLNDPVTTIRLFKRIISTYPSYKNLPTITFLTGYVYENQLKDLINSKKYYLQLLDKYPNSDFADDAEISLKNLGKSPEEMIMEFEK